MKRQFVLPGQDFPVQRLKPWRQKYVRRRLRTGSLLVAKVRTTGVFRQLGEGGGSAGFFTGFERDAPVSIEGKASWPDFVAGLYRAGFWC